MTVFANGSFSSQRQNPSFNKIFYMTKFAPLNYSAKFLFFALFTAKTVFKAKFCYLMYYIMFGTLCKYQFVLFNVEKL